MPLKRHLALSILSAAALSLSLPAGAAWAQATPYESVEAPRAWRVDVGGGVVHGFSPTGAADDVSWTAWGSANYRDIVYANGLDGLGWNAVLRDDFRAGVQIRPRFAAGEIEGSSLDRPGLGADAALYAFKRLPGNIVVGGRVAHDVSGDDAGTTYFASVGHQRVTRVGLLQVTGYANAGDADRTAHYFGVSPDQAPGSGYEAFTPGGGLSSAGAVALLAIPIGERVGLGGFVNYERRLGDARDSPLVDDDDVWRAGLIVVVRFAAPR